MYIAKNPSAPMKSANIRMNDTTHRTSIITHVFLLPPMRNRTSGGKRRPPAAYRSGSLRWYLVDGGWVGGGVKARYCVLFPVDASGIFRSASASCGLTSSAGAEWSLVM